jgi:hypothetical protein
VGAELFELDDLERAKARFEELGREHTERCDPLRIPPNAATRMRDRIESALAAGDWPALRALAAPDFVFDDRGRFSRVRGDIEIWIRNAEQMRGVAGARMARERLATAGERLALERAVLAGAPESGAFEIELLILTEVDADDRLAALIAFDPDDRRAAGAEMLERYARSDEARWVPAAVFEFGRALNDHDLARLRAALPDDFVFHDHRRTGVGTIEGADAYVASVVPLLERAPGWTMETLRYLAQERHGSLSMVRVFGTLAEGGEFESLNLRLVLYRGDQIAGIELFEPEDLDRAKARFEELRPEEE